MEYARSHKADMEFDLKEASFRTKVFSKGARLLGGKKKKS